MPKCCRCNGSGMWRTCSCAKAGRCCTNCLPHQNGHCENIAIDHDHDDHEQPPGPEQTIVIGMQEGMQEGRGEPSNTAEEELSERDTRRISNNHLLDLEFETNTTYQPTSTENGMHGHERQQSGGFRWEEMDGDSFCQLVTKAYEEVVHWRRNILLLPSGKAGKCFIRELTRLFQAYGDASTLDCISLKACFVMQSLLLQKPHSKSKAKEHSTHLERRMRQWLNGDIEALLREGRCIQKHLTSTGRMMDKEACTREFNRLMLQGKVNAAMRVISNASKGGLLSMNVLLQIGTDQDGESIWQTTRDVLLEKHPKGKEAHAEILLPEADIRESNYDPIIFESITGKVIRQVANHTQGAAGPSGVDSYAWRRFCSSFKSASVDLCNALAAVAHRLCTQRVQPKGLSALVAGCLIPLNKNPGVRPIGIGEVPRQIIAKAILKVVCNDIQLAAGPLQACAGHEAGCEAAVHAMKEVFASDDTEAILLVDATNAFNTINRQAALHNIIVICPSISTVLNSTYRHPIRLFVVGGGEIESSSEGTTQGDPLAMAMYALAVTPLI